MKKRGRGSTLVVTRKAASDIYPERQSRTEESPFQRLRELCVLCGLCVDTASSLCVSPFDRRLSTCCAVLFHGSRNTGHGSPVPLLRYSAIKRFCANGHSRSIHWPSHLNPVRFAISRISSARYLCELSVQIVSSSS